MPQTKTILQTAFEDLFVGKTESIVVKGVDSNFLVCHNYNHSLTQTTIDHIDCNHDVLVKVIVVFVMVVPYLYHNPHKVSSHVDVLGVVMFLVR